MHFHVNLIWGKKYVVIDTYIVCIKQKATTNLCLKAVTFSGHNEKKFNQNTR